jgi:LmbE family N-acetylglucosaminyl deacetylase
MKRVVAVLAHPDDEFSVSGTLAGYARNGAHTALICVTRGEAGEISDPTLATAENLGAVREAELRCSCERIGIDELHLLDYCDSGMEGTPENDKATAFIQAEPDDVRLRLVRLYRSIKPHVVITFEPNGWYGHPDHVATSRHASESYRLAGDPAAFPEAGPPWQPMRLFHVVFLGSQFKPIADYAREHGLDVGDLGDLNWEEPDPLADQITHEIDVSAFSSVKLAAAECHRTQFAPDHILRRVPRDALLASVAVESFIQVDPVPEPAAEPQSDLFAGIDA